MSNEKRAPGSSGYLIDYTTQLCGDSSKPSIRIPIKQGVGPSDISFSLNDFFPKGKRATLFYYRVSWDHVDERHFLGRLELFLGPEVKMIFVQKFSKHESFGKNIQSPYTVVKVDG